MTATRDAEFSADVSIARIKLDESLPSDMRITNLKLSTNKSRFYETRCVHNNSLGIIRLGGDKLALRSYLIFRLQESRVGKLASKKEIRTCAWSLY